MTVSVTVERDTASPALAALAGLVENSTAIVGAMGHRLVRDTSAHVAQWGLSHPNKLGGKRTNYWAGIAAKINPADTMEVSGHRAVITLGGNAMPGLMRAFGPVTIVPGTKTPGVKYIPLPARSESYGMRPREFGAALMVFWKGPGQPGGLAQAVATTRQKSTKKGAKGSTYFRPGLVFYWFTKSVTQPQDRSLLPSEEEWSASANAGGHDYAVQQLNKITGGAA